MDSPRKCLLQANRLDYHITRLVRIRLFYLLLQYLLVQMGGYHPGGRRADMEVIWSEHRDLPL